MWGVFGVGGCTERGFRCYGLLLNRNASFRREMQHFYSTICFGRVWPEFFCRILRWLCTCVFGDVIRDGLR